MLSIFNINKIKSKNSIRGEHRYKIVIDYLI